MNAHHGVCPVILSFLFQDLLREAKAAPDSNRIQIRSKGKQVRTYAEGVFCHVWSVQECLVLQ